MNLYVLMHLVFLEYNRIYSRMLEELQYCGFALSYLAEVEKLPWYFDYTGYYAENVY